jgi:hypothetical protein
MEIYIYVVISLSAIHRLSQHKISAQWVAEAVRMETQWFATRDEASKEEVKAINSENPRFNVAHNTKKHVSKAPENPVIELHANTATLKRISHLITVR